MYENDTKQSRAHGFGIELVDMNDVQRIATRWRSHLVLCFSAHASSTVFNPGLPALGPGLAVLSTVSRDFSPCQHPSMSFGVPLFSPSGLRHPDNGLALISTLEALRNIKTSQVSLMMRGYPLGAQHFGIATTQLANHLCASLNRHLIPHPCPFALASMGCHCDTCRAPVMGFNYTTKLGRGREAGLSPRAGAPPAAYSLT